MSLYRTVLIVNKSEAIRQAFAELGREGIDPIFNHDIQSFLFTTFGVHASDSLIAAQRRRLKVSGFQGLGEAK